MYEASGRKVGNFLVFNIVRMSRNSLKITVIIFDNLNELLQPWMSQISFECNWEKVFVLLLCSLS